MNRRNGVSSASAECAGRDQLLRILETKYLFHPEVFKERVDLPEKVNDLTRSLVILQSPNGAPFLLGAVATSHSVTETVFDYVLSTETIGIVVLLGEEDKQLKIYRRHFDQPKFDEVPDLEYYYRGSIGPQGILIDQDTERKKARSQQLLPISNKLENLFFEIHSTMRDIDGLHADEALEELCKLLYVKIYDEELAANDSHEPIHTRLFGTTEEYAASVRQLYRQAVDYDLRVFRLKIPQYERSRGVFTQPVRLSSAALTRCFQLLENYSLTNSRSDVKGRAFQKVLSRAVRSGMGQYFTPAQLCELMVRVVQPKVTDLILDPFCGSGHFLSEALRYVSNTVPRTTKQFHEFAFGKLHGIEKSDRMTRIAMTDMRLNGDGHSNIRCTDALLDFANYPDISPGSFDIVLTNPPFGSLLGPQALAGLAKFDLSEHRRNMPLEVLGLERSIEFLRPGGRLGIVLPDNILSADSFEYVRQWLRKKVSVRAIVSLPVAAFSPFGANVKTSIFFARKWKTGEVQDETSTVCLLKLENIGYDAAGRLVDSSEVDEAIAAVSEFLEKNGW